MIAAGEVVERPASVVKELVENSIDAGSSKIDVLVKDGGKRLIRVADNGDGMGREDALLSLERHATSKIGSIADLGRITTMGFRGEALASIASVSRMTIATKERDALEGTEIITEGGVVRDVRAAGIPHGTIVEVSDLFFNTPARKKFLKTTTTEMGHISDYVARAALAFSAISFTLRSDGSVVHDLPAASDMRERVCTLLGNDDARGLLEVDEEGAKMRLSGFISPPSVQRSTAAGLYIYINGRFVRDKVVRHAILQGYSTFIMRGRYPLAILFIEIAPGEVDVNVHPAKSEVRFRNSKTVHSLVSSAVERAMRKREWLGGSQTAPDMAERVREAAAEYVVKNERLPLSGGYSSREGDFPPRDDDLNSGGRRDTGHELPKAEERAEAEVKGYFSSLDVIGQLNEMYILCQGGEGMLIIDQHAACERIAYEELKAGYDKRSFRVQQLLIPEMLDLPPRESSALEENMEDISRLGFDMEHFGGRSYVIKAVPSILGTKGVNRMIADMASELADGPASRSFADALDSIIKRLACHSVVRGRRRMTHDEMRSLLKRMDAAGIVPHCPHGRPAHIDIPVSEIEKRFERT